MEPKGLLRSRVSEMTTITWEIEGRLSTNHESTTGERLVHTLISCILMLSEDMSILDGWWFREKEGKVEAEQRERSPQ